MIAKNNHKDCLRTNIIPQSLYKTSILFKKAITMQIIQYSSFSYAKNIKQKMHLYIKHIICIALRQQEKTKSLPVLSAEFTEIHTCRSA